MVGLSVVIRDQYGVFPLKGTLLNVRVASSKKIRANEEFQHIKKILKQDEIYTSTESLRYGRVMIMADQVRVSELHYLIMCYVSFLSTKL